MNVPLTTLAPLPQALQHQHRPGQGRRHRVLEHEIDREALRHFNDLLEYLDLPQAPLDSDQVATAARELLESTRGGSAPRCIQQRMRRAAAIDLMAEDPDWELGHAAAVRAKLVVVDYLHGSFDLIPRSVQVVGRLDDAILVEAAWPSLASEVGEYVAFRRLRHVEALLRGESRTHFGFTRALYRDAAQAEAAWIAHCQRVDQETYLPRGTIPAFRIH